MVSPLSLYLFALTLLCMAAALGRFRRIALRDALTDGAAALAEVTLAFAAAIVFFAFWGPPAASTLWRDAGSVALLASPLSATLVLRYRSRRSIPRALISSTLALAGVVLWLTLNLRGPRGGWTLVDIALVFPAAAIAVASAACLGWWSKGRAGRKAVPTMAILSLLLLCVSGCKEGSAGHEQHSTLVLTLRDAATGAPTPARVELLDEHGNTVIPEDALAVFADCGNVPVHAWVPGFATLQALRNGHRAVANPFTGTTQFYVDGTVRVQLPAGRYIVRATKGIEYERAEGTIVVTAGEDETRFDLDLRRWIDLARDGWYGADDHLHIPRPHPRFDPRLATWMEAEGLHVGNFLQMGLAQDVHITPQHGFGPRTAFQRGNTLLLSGQENPRTHVLGHAIVLGAHRFVDLPQQYLRYDQVWEGAHRHGAVNGYAHWGLGGAEEGLALWGHEALLDFVEVLNLGFPFYDRWYEALDLGIRLGPTAGTDYPCLPSLPGRERFYAKLDVPLTAEPWLAAVRQGKTFVTNGPVIELAVEEASPGGELTLAAPGTVEVHGRVRFDPERDTITALELVRGGVVVARVDTPTAAGEMLLETTLQIDQTTWLALRASGVKRGETEIDLHGLFATMLVLERPSNEELLAGLPKGLVPRPSAAHTGAILVNVADTPPLAEQPRGREVAQIWRARLDALAHRFDEGQMEGWARFPGRGDGIDLQTAEANRAALLQAIEAARRHYAKNVPE